ncbi:MAG: response regulator [Clostridia bacterium]|nr:response regulator [Clostridia bacterium]MBN2882652.1 response regulator [Clostridia bacterium]
MAKMRVFIVDDEDMVREGLETYVPWYDYGMEVVGTASNGREAYEYLSCNDVELVISDIYMPHMDGLEMIEKLKEINKNPIVVLISGHSDFDYAKRAIKSKMVFEYILKPINFEELDKVISQVREKILEKPGSSFPVLNDTEWKRFSQDEKDGKISLQADILNAISLSDKQSALKLFEKSSSHMKNSSYSVSMAARYCIELIVGITELVLEQRNSREVLMEDPITEINTKNLIDEIFDYTKSVIIKGISVISRKENKDLSPVIGAALDYIRENYNKHEQSLNGLADRLNVSPNYLCLKFKEETGTNYTKYLNSLRVKHAKELLKDVRLKVYMVSDMVGFEDTRYFSRIFRSYTGYTPTEFQKKETVRK